MTQMMAVVAVHYVKHHMENVQTFLVWMLLFQQLNVTMEKLLQQIAAGSMLQVGHILFP
tara:strand:- start:1787 stop:1963 length:177 start_codon:yes stop_codon:yes gene_type:complete